jgi:zinc protease
MTAMMLGAAGTRRRPYAQVLEELFPMAASIGVEVDKEMLSFGASVHADHLEAFSALLCEMLVDPGWREEDFERLRDDSVNLLEVGLRHQNEEELAKEVLAQRVFGGHPYEWCNPGTVSSLSRLTVADCRRFWLDQFARENLTIALGGGYPRGFDTALEREFSSLPLKPRPPRAIGPAAEPRGNRLTLIEKPARSVAISLGFPIAVTRSHADYAALLVAVSALGQHRMSSGRLFQTMRQARGLNYGDYAYIEHFPGGMYTLEPPPNVARSRQVFEIWVRPVEHGQAHFALRLAVSELERLVDGGLDREEFERARSFLGKYVQLMEKTKSAQLGSLVDSEFYGTGPYAAWLRRELAALTAERVHEAVRRHLRAERLEIVMAGENMKPLADAIVSEAPSPMRYNAPKTESLLAEDEVVARRRLEIAESAVQIVPVEEVFA